MTTLSCSKNAWVRAASALMGALLPLALAGCVSAPTMPDAATTHPANPQAVSSPVPPLQPSLLAITNALMVKPVTDPTPEHHHGHEKHDMKPKAEEKK